MKRRVFSGLAVLTVAMLTMCGCAGISAGKIGETSTQAGVAPRVAPTELTLGVVGDLPAGTAIGAIDMILKLPAGVEVKADKVGETLPGVVVASGVAAGALTVSKYTPAEGAGSATLRSAYIMREGFGVGEFARVRFVFSGKAPKAEDFSFSRLVVSNVDGQRLTGMTGVVTVTLKAKP